MIRNSALPMNSKQNYALGMSRQRRPKEDEKEQTAIKE